jgi:hypothetical protein
MFLSGVCRLLRRGEGDGESLRFELPGCRRPRERLVGTLSGERCGGSGGRTSDESSPETVGGTARHSEDEDEDGVRYTQLG